MSNRIELKSIGELLGMNFFIPDYQRGFRWVNQQVKDLLDDIDEFISEDRNEIYCIQPLVIKMREQKTFELIKNEAKNLDEIRSYLKGNWEVIDGQQRLTTIHILLNYLKIENKYNIDYKTRPNSKTFLLNINEEQKEYCIDSYHIVEVKKSIANWFSVKDSDYKDKFSNILLDKVKFIWYESVDEDPIKVFTRLNIGKISLTNAELIKALFLTESNFIDNDYQKTRLYQQEIAGEWDKIEYNLQNDEFWLFLNDAEYDKPTRIDLIFDLISEMNLLDLSKDEIEKLGKDEYRTFRYFYVWYSKERKTKEIDISKSWSVVKTIFQTFNEWFNDLELYHYIGFLIEHRIKITRILEEWNKPGKVKIDFISDFIIPEIKKTLTDCSDLNKQYEVNGSPKTQCRPILLLHNIQSVINQNKSIKENEKYKLPVFYKFPFHLFKKENWDVEHIDSHTENPLEKDNERKEWLGYSYEFIDDKAELKDGKNLKEEIKKFITHDESKPTTNFEDLWSRIIDLTSSNKNKLEDGIIDEKGNTVNEKDKLWNFTLLDSSTNRSYGNAIFAAKRRIIIGKDQGKEIIINDELNVEEIDGAIAFIPPSTKNAFLKYYNPFTNNLREWNKDDAESYLNNIKTVIDVFKKNQL